ncbi:MAG: amidohydrolase family protein [Clostridia bacterium]|nr:amidohydrolase family protein [Clostridia bacterium]
MSDYIFNEKDKFLVEKLKEFLPNKIFDSHMHVFNKKNDELFKATIGSYNDDLSMLLKGKELYYNAIIMPNMLLTDKLERDKAVDFLVEELNNVKNAYGEILVLKNDTEEDVKRLIRHDKIRGIKCYYYYADCEDKTNSNVYDYLPLSALKVANEKKMYVTIHLVKDDALANKENINQIKEISKNYPNITIILAHVGRSFAGWTLFDGIDNFVDCENVFFDFSAICESPQIAYAIKKVGVKRCLWGSDYPISMFEGKAVSIGTGFYWIGENDIKKFNSFNAENALHVFTENLLAVRQACMLLDVDKKGVEDIFFNNMFRLVNQK